MVGKIEGRFADMTTISCIARLKLRISKESEMYLYFVMLPIRHDIFDVRDILNGINSCRFQVRKEGIGRTSK
jgi:hypothetical protein